MAYTYNTFLAAMSQNMLLGTSDADFVAWLPQIIQNAELRIYRDLDLLATRKTATISFAINNPIPTTPVDCVIVRFIGVTDGSGNYTELDERDESFVRQFNAGAAAGVPKFFAQNTFGSIYTAPVPLATYSGTCGYTYRPTSLANANQNTFLATWLPDIFMAASMVEAMLLQRNLEKAQAWLANYQTLLKTGAVEEVRRKSRTEADILSPTEAPPIS